MSIFVSEIAFNNAPNLVNITKISILGASIISILLAYTVATLTYKSNEQKRSQ